MTAKFVGHHHLKRRDGARFVALRFPRDAHCDKLTRTSPETCLTTPPGSRNPKAGMTVATWSIGNVSVSRIEEQLGFASLPPQQYLAGFERATLAQHLHWLVPDHYCPEHHRLITSIHSWLIRTPHHTILLDSCAGNHKNRPGQPRFHRLDTPYLDRLHAAGVRPEEIDIVLCTHLHSDHVGWNTRLIDGRWVPTFPNARYLFSKTERELGDPRTNPHADANPQRSNAFRDSVLPIIESGQAELIDGDHAIDDSLSILPAPGHTAGHVALWITDAGGRAVFCGDAIHHALQVYAPHWNSAFDEAPDLASATRRKLMEACAEHRATMFPGHFGAPHVARILESPTGFVPQFVNAGAVTR
jgi:glyoxylase-like metal-dependent hydrolase (beta-lactamase superfamily II)